MTGPIRAQVRRIMKSPEGRALVHAVDDAGLEYKIEVPLAAIREARPDDAHVLVISWSLQAEPATTSAPAQPALRAHVGAVEAA